MCYIAIKTGQLNKVQPVLVSCTYLCDYGPVKCNSPNSSCGGMHNY